MFMEFYPNTWKRLGGNINVKENPVGTNSLRG